MTTQLSVSTTTRLMTLRQQRNGSTAAASSTFTTLETKLDLRQSSPILTGTHHCSVAEISFRDTPIATVASQTASPSNSDKLAQRNLSVIYSDNPGGPETHLVPQTFDPRPSFTTTGDPTKTMELPDELQIEWGNTEPGSTASIYWPQVNVPEVLALSKKLYSTH
jgi:hypothetical protein